jgi:hypothetical protein
MHESLRGESEWRGSTSVAECGKYVQMRKVSNKGRIRITLLSIEIAAKSETSPVEWKSGPVIHMARNITTKVNV